MIESRHTVFDLVSEHAIISGHPHFFQFVFNVYYYFIFIIFLF